MQVHLSLFCEFLNFELESNSECNVFTFSAKMFCLGNTCCIVSKLSIYVMFYSGHSMANLTQSEKCVQQGAKLITHLFNAMLPFHHRLYFAWQVTMFANTLFASVLNFFVFACYLVFIR